MLLFIYEDSGVERKEDALFSSSMRREKNKKKSDRLDAKDRLEIERSVGYDDYNINREMLSAQDFYLMKVFPIFLILVGVAVILISILTEVESKVPLTIGISVTVAAVIWDLFAIIQGRRKKAENFRKGGNI